MKTPPYDYFLPVEHCEHWKQNDKRLLEIVVYPLPMTVHLSIHAML